MAVRRHPFRDIAVRHYHGPIAFDAPELLVVWKPSLVWVAALLLILAGLTWP